jgi:hypothetical protein
MILLGLDLCFIAVLVALLAAMAKLRRRQWAESSLILHDWAHANGYAILFQERGPLWVSPLLPVSYQVVYRVVIADRRGRRWRGWASCGRNLLETSSRRVAVSWDQPGPGVALSWAKDEPLWDEELDA